MSLVETDWLEKNLNDVKIIDCSWHMPQTKRNGYEEYNKEHIAGSIFFSQFLNSFFSGRPEKYKYLGAVERGSVHHTPYGDKIVTKKNSLHNKLGSNPALLYPRRW